MRKLGFLVLVGSVGIACAVPPALSYGSRDDDVSSKKSDPSGSSSPPGSFGDSTSAGDDLPPAQACAANAQLVYVISDANDLYSFAPDKLKFTKVGTLNCPVTNKFLPNSMAVDRTGTAWVNYDDDSIFK